MKMQHLSAGTLLIGLMAVSCTSVQAQNANQDIQKQIDDLRRLVEEQRKEISDQRKEISDLRSQLGLPAPTQPATKPPATLSTPSRERVSVYGFLRLDAIWDSGAANNTQAPLFVQSPSNANIRRPGNSVLNFNSRISRLGFNLTAPADTIKGTNVTGKLE